MDEYAKWLDIMSKNELTKENAIIYYGIIDKHGESETNNNLKALLKRYTIHTAGMDYCNNIIHKTKIDAEKNIFSVLKNDIENIKDDIISCHGTLNGDNSNTINAYKMSVNEAFALLKTYYSVTDSMPYSIACTMLEKIIDLQIANQLYSYLLISAISGHHIDIDGIKLILDGEEA